ncbi:hypothetical protein TKK_0007194 [Trichogramma kaykai]
MSFLTADFIDDSESINIILVREETAMKCVKTYVDKYSQMFPNSNRPKTLVILLGIKSKSASHIKSISKYGWSKQFLDISFVQEDDACVVKMYNPFSTELMKKTINDKPEEIFPNKLLNVFGQKMVIGVNSEDKLVIVERNESEHAIGVLKPLYNETKLVLKSMNFSIDSIVEIKDTKYPQGLNILIEKLRNNEVNLMAVPRGYTVIYENITHVYTERDCFSITALYAERFKAQIQFPKKIVQSFLMVTGAVGLSVWFFKLTKIFSHKITVLKVLGALFGISVKLNPSKNAEIIFLTSIFLISTTYPTDFYSNFIEEKLVQNTKTFNSFKSIDESNLDIFIFTAYTKLLQEINDVNAMNLKKKGEAFTNAEDCVEGLIAKRNRVCIGALDALQVAVEVVCKEKDYHLLYADLNFGCYARSYLFERASPYSDRFQNKLRQLREYGIDVFIKRGYDKFKVEDQENGRSLSPDLFHIHLIFIVASGVILSLCVFVIESLLNSIVIKKKKFEFFYRLLHTFK